LAAQDGRLKRMSHLKGWTSPRLGIRFALGGNTLAIFDPQGQPFLTSVERAERLCGAPSAGPCLSACGVARVS